MGDWTKFGQVSNICPIFVQFMSKFCICPIFVQSRVKCLIFVYYLSKVCTEKTNLSKNFNDGQNLDECLSNICPLFNRGWAKKQLVQPLSRYCQCQKFVQYLSNFFRQGFRDILSDFCPMFVHVQYLSMSKVCPTLKTTLVGYHSFTSTKIIWALHWISLSTRDIGLEQIRAISHSRCKRLSTPHYNRF